MYQLVLTGFLFRHHAQGEICKLGIGGLGKGPATQLAVTSFFIFLCTTSSIPTTEHKLHAMEGATGGGGQESGNPRKIWQQANLPPPLSGYNCNIANNRAKLIGVDPLSSASRLIS